jgi:integrase/recombinase XerC
MAVKSKRILFYDEEKIKNLNSETIKLYNKYKIDMTLRELSESTIEGYENDLQHWFIYIYDNQANQCITELIEDDITEFLYYCKVEGNNSRRMKRRMSSISAFYKFLRRKKIITENPMEFMERPKKDTDIAIQTFLTQEQVDLMKQKLKENGNLQMETYALLSLSTMARVNAISNIRWEQIDFDNRTINDVLEKEAKMVTLYFNPNVKDLLLKLKQDRVDKCIDNEYVFLSFYGQQFNRSDTSTLQEWTKKIGVMIGVPSLHPHDFRHSASQLMKLAGAPIEEISELLNHSGIDVTRKHYLRQDKKKVQENKDKYGI